MPYNHTSWTPRRHAARAEHIAALKAQVSVTDGKPHPCGVRGCAKPAESRIARYCKGHGSHYRRHGHGTKATYSATASNPFRRIALRWLQESREGNYFIPLAVQSVHLAYHRAGETLPLSNHRGATTEAKANAVWGRLRGAGVDPLYVIAAVVGTVLTIEADPEKPYRSQLLEFHRVQVAKVLMRMAGGRVRRYARSPVTLESGQTATPAARELRQFANSSGRVLRVLGAMALDVCELITEEHLSDIEAFAATITVTPAMRKTPWPAERAAKRKPRIAAEHKPTGVFAVRAEQKRRRQLERDRKRKAAAIANTPTPEQEAARQPSIIAFKGGRWITE
jgi:hypothetical protein